VGTAQEAVAVQHLRRQGVVFVHHLRWVALGALAGILAGLSSWVFLRGLTSVTRWREDGRQWLLYFLPIVGLAMGSAYHYAGGRSAHGNNLLLDEIHEPTQWVPRRMAPLVLISTWASHLFGASVGREGTAVQMSGGLTDGLARVLRLRPADRRLLLIGALAGGFGAVFGVPIAGAVFALEVQAVGRVRYEALVPALTASLVGDGVVRALGYHHEHYDPLRVHVDPWLLARIAVAGLAFGLVAAAYSELTHAIKTTMARLIAWPPFRPAVGGLAIMALVLFFGHQYQGLSLPLLNKAISGEHLVFSIFALKLAFTAVTLGTGFIGGEVTPLFVIGATLGSALSLALGIDPRLLAVVGFCAVFAGASNTPLACTIIGVELFGAAAIVPVAVGCVVAYACSGTRSIYSSQREQHTKTLVGERQHD
jgi:H+/Cl- antiporter ClcA